MKMMLGNTPVKSLNIHHFEMDTNSATVQPSDLQAGITCFARGQKVTGTGKSFEFAHYGRVDTNVGLFAPTLINVTEIACLDYPIRASMALNTMKNVDFSTAQTIGHVVIDNVEYPITAQVVGVILTFACEKTIELQYFCGKDNYV